MTSTIHLARASELFPATRPLKCAEDEIIGRLLNIALFLIDRFVQSQRDVPTIALPVSRLLLIRPPINPNI